MPPPTLRLVSDHDPSTAPDSLEQRPVLSLVIDQPKDFFSTASTPGLMQHTRQSISGSRAERPLETLEVEMDIFFERRSLPMINKIQELKSLLANPQTQRNESEPQTLKEQLEQKENDLATLNESKDYLKKQMVLLARYATNLDYAGILLPTETNTLLQSLCDRIGPDFINPLIEFYDKLCAKVDRIVQNFRRLGIAYLMTSEAGLNPLALNDLDEVLQMMEEGYRQFNQKHHQSMRSTFGDQKFYDPHELISQMTKAQKEGYDEMGTDHIQESAGYKMLLERVDEFLKMLEGQKPSDDLAQKFYSLIMFNLIYMKDAISAQAMVSTDYIKKEYPVSNKDAFWSVKFVMSLLNRCVRAMEIVEYQKNFLVTREAQAAEALPQDCEVKSA